MLRTVAQTIRIKDYTSTVCLEKVGSVEFFCIPARHIGEVNVPEITMVAPPLFHGHRRICDSECVCMIFILMTGTILNARGFSNYSCTISACTAGGCTESLPTLARTLQLRAYITVARYLLVDITLH